jgi:diguanylate cyclase (GGDEF)-like protein
MEEIKSTGQPEFTEVQLRQRRDLFLRYYANAQAFFSAQNYREAFKEIRHAGEIEPLNMKLAQLAIEIFKRTQNGENLTAICEKMIEIEPDNIDLQLDLALGHFLIGNYPAVIDSCTYILTKDLNDSQELTCTELLADALRKKNEFEKAKNYYLKIVERVTGVQRILIKLTGCYYRLGDHKNVVVTAGRLIEMGYNDENIINLYNFAVEKTEKNIGKLYKPKSFLQSLFRKGYDPVYAHLMNLELEKEHAERRVDTEQRKRYTDTLTGANNRAFFDERLLSYFTPDAATKNTDKKTGFVFCFFDIDKFKTINDEYGHKMGDAVLIEFAKIGKDFFKQDAPGIGGQPDRQLETWCRYGGEEFVALFFGDKAAAFKKTEEFRLFIQSTLHIKVQQSQGKPVRIVTCSGGLAEFPAEVKDFTEAHQLADKRLYYAKNNGRNQVIKDGDGWTAALPESSGV